MEESLKQLLLTDLCARLPYGLQVKTEGDNEPYILLSVHLNKDIALIGIDMGGIYATSKVKIDTVKPYLRPMSSMTEEEKEKLKSLYNAENVTNESIYFLENGPLEEYEIEVPFIFCCGIVDWLNKKMFDYRGLIPEGISLEAPEGMYNIKEQ